MITTDEVKASVLSYWRYKKQCPFVALEANCSLNVFNEGGQADVLAINRNGRLIETEIKLSMADFHRDQHKLKHRYLRENRGLRWPTAYFYFAVPKELANQVSLECGNLYPYAGVLGSNGEDIDVEVYRRSKIRIAKRLTLLQITRMSYEQGATLCRLAREVANLRGKGDKDHE